LSRSAVPAVWHAPPVVRDGAARQAYRAALRTLPVGLRRRLLFVRYHRRLPHLARPATFSEKVNWRILHDRRALLAGTCDKLAMKELALATAGDLVRVPRTLWTGTDVGELAGVALPAHWVLKANHLSGCVHFGSGPADVASLRPLVTPWVASARLADLGEWAYGKARRCLVVEEHISDGGPAPVDYKVFVFGGVPRLVQVDTTRFAGHEQRRYTPDWEPLPYVTRYPLGPVVPPPERLADLLLAASRIAADFDFLRVDLYEAAGEIWFGETTPYPDGGLVRFRPDGLDEELGRHWTLPDAVARQSVGA
jgi:TupA-like ATPgrasp